MKLAPLNNTRVTIDNFKVCLSGFQPESQRKLMTTNAHILNCQVGQPPWKPRVDIKLVVRASGMNPNIACVSMNADPAAHACGTFAPIYCTGNVVSSRWNAV